MKKYSVTIYATASTEVIVEAENEKEAMEKAFYTDFQWSDYDGYDFHVEELKEGPAVLQRPS